MPRNRRPQANSEPARESAKSHHHHHHHRQELSAANEDVIIDTNKTSTDDILGPKETSELTAPSGTTGPQTDTAGSSIQEKSKVEGESLHPFVHWAQSQTHISLRVDLIQAQKLKVFIEEDFVNLKFSAQGTGAHGLQNYYFALTFHSEVERKFECHTIGRYVLILIKKLQPGSSWPRLTKQATKLPWLRVDFDRYTGDDSDDNVCGDSDNDDEESDHDDDDDEENIDFDYKGTLLEEQQQQQHSSDNESNASENINFHLRTREVSKSGEKNLGKLFAQNNSNNNRDIFNPFRRKLVKTNTNKRSESKMKYNHRKDSMDTMENSGKNTAKHALDFKKAYLFLYNLVMFIMFLKVFLVLLIKSASGPVEDDIVRGTAFIVRILTYAQLLEAVHPMLGLVPGSPFVSLIQASGRLLVNQFLVADEIRQGAYPFVHYLFIVWSAIEIARYSYYALNVYKVKIYALTWLRYSLFLPLYPCGGFCESQVVFSTIRYYEKTEDYGISLPNSANISFNIPTALRIYVFFLLGPTILSLIRYMFKQRAKQLVKEKAA